MTFLELAKKVLEEVGQPLTSEEIWAAAEKLGYATQLGSAGKTPWHSIGAQVYVNMRDRKDSPFAKVGSRPRRFVLKSLIQKLNLSHEELGVSAPAKLAKTVEGPSYSEKDLHPFLAYFAFYYLKAYTRTIEHPKSTKKEFGEWVHPDVVGCSFVLEDWKSEVVDLSSALGSLPVKLFSFELKKELNFGNLRESFFQCVSNSSWANEAYLVAAEISNDEDFLSELGRLSTSFAIGVVRLDVADPDSSSVIFPAKEREILDWDAINKLTMNNDFREFLRRIKNDLTSKEIRKEKYDRVFERDELIKTISTPNNNSK